MESDASLIDLGSEKTVEAVVALGTLSDADVEVQLIHGPVASSEEIRPPQTVTMSLGGKVKEGLYRYTGSFDCGRAGRYGFTVRVVPRHGDLTTFAELGCATGAGSPGG